MGDERADAETLVVSLPARSGVLRKVADFDLPEGAF